VELTREQQWQMLVMSDLSGPSFRVGFDGYLTGYPLEAGGFYCVAKTWFAPELPRPGCVWTHTLLIADANVAQMSDLRTLSRHFRRPRNVEDLEAYDSVIEVDVANPPEASGETDPILNAALISLLYGEPARKIVLTAGEGREFEDAVATIFRQQWPRLRRSFRFCTGALAIRDVDFDLAIAPPNVARQDTERTPAVTLQALDAPGDVHKRDEWVRLAAEDLGARENQTPLRRFLWAFGPDYSDGRAAFLPLCEVFVASTHSAQSVDEVLSALGHFFPEPESSRRLKATFFGISGSFSASKGESAVLAALVSHPATTCVPSDIAVVEQRARQLVATDPRSAIEIGLMSANVGTSRADEYLRGLLEGVRGEPNVLVDAPSLLIFNLVKEEPGLLTRTALWQVAVDQQLALAARLVSLPRTEELSRGVTTAILNAEAWAALGSAMSWFGLDGVTAVLHWIEARPGDVVALPSAISSALREHRNDLIRALSDRHYGPRALLASSALLDPRSQDVRRLTATVWTHATAHSLRFDDPLMELRSRVFLLSVGLSAGSEGVSLVREGFAAVYEGAKEGGGVDDQLWGFVEPYLPWYRVTWDRCARLIRGVVRQFLEQRWPAAEFLSTFRTAEQLDRALDEASGSLRGSRYIRRVCAARRERLLPHDPRVAILARYCRHKVSKPIPELN
jgi:hypothetical protein